tara:strand:- start:8309 stop:8767 length:459 start_codon:yes stop_codon:yes gene_type:complete
LILPSDIRTIVLFNLSRQTSSSHSIQEWLGLKTYGNWRMIGRLTVTGGDRSNNYLSEKSMADAVILGGDRYHKAEEAHQAIGPILEKARLDVHYTDDFASIDADLLNEKNYSCFCETAWNGQMVTTPTRRFGCSLTKKNLSNSSFWMVAHSS